MKSRIIWQHCGRLFSARAILDGGLVSAPCAAMEPDTDFNLPPGHRLKLGEGVYRAPGLPHLQLVVGKLVIEAVFGQFHKVANRAAEDRYGRMALAVEAYESNREKIKRVYQPKLVDDDWNQVRI